MKSHHDERGAAAVEFALLAPVLVLMVMGIAEFGRAYHVQATISQAAREGVRVMALNNDPAGAIVATQAAAAAVDPDLTLTNITVTPSSCVSSGAAPAVNATVTVTFPFTFISNLFGTGLTLTGTGVMRCNG